MELVSLAGHMHTQNGRAAEGIWSWENTAPGEEPQTYRMAFMTTREHINYPVEGCMGDAATRTAVQVQFSHLHVRDNVVILEKGNLPHPQ